MPAPSEEDADEDDDNEPPHLIVNTSQPILSLSTRPMRVNMTLSQRRTPPRARAFFDDLINMPSPSKEPGRPRPRIVYIRDYPLLEPTSSSWFPSLLAAVRAYRQGPLPRPTSPIEHPLVIIFGSTPPLVASRTPPSNPSSSHPSSALLNLLLNRRSVAAPARRNAYKASDPWDESDVAQKGRERRLQDRLRHWERNDSQFYEDLPDPPSTSEPSSGPNPSEQGIMIMAPGQSFPPGMLPSQSNDLPGSEINTRLTVLVPHLRMAMVEKQSRISRRQHINELICRMAVGTVGGILTDKFKISEVSLESQEEVETPKQDTASQEISEVTTEEPAEQTLSSAIVPGTELFLTQRVDMWGDWGQRVEAWPSVKQIAQRTVGRIAASLRDSPTHQTMSSLLDPLPIPWSAVEETWTLQRNFRKNERTWIEKFSEKPADEESGKKSEEAKDEPVVDEVIERVKRDATLDPHETRLLGCIVDPGKPLQPARLVPLVIYFNLATMTTSFDQVHLPAHTIDSVRTIVSLPLLHPDAFSHGILKQHAMTGALLFGPPGTGKTLVVRALAKESGSRMLLIKPSDVMDMVCFHEPFCVFYPLYIVKFLVCRRGRKISSIRFFPSKTAVAVCRLFR